MSEKKGRREKSSTGVLKAPRKQGRPKGPVRRRRRSLPKKIFHAVRDFASKNAFFWTFSAVSPIIIALLIYYLVGVTGDLQKANEIRDEVFEEYRMVSRILQDENNALYKERLEGAFTKEQILKMKERHTSYALLVNNRHISGDTSIINSTTDRIVVTFVERFSTKGMEILPLEILYDYSYILEDELENRIFISTNEATYTISTQMVEDGRRVSLHFDNVYPGEIITLDTTFEFSQMLDLDDGSVEIFYTITG